MDLRTAGQDETHAKAFAEDAMRLFDLGRKAEAHSIFSDLANYGQASGFYGLGLISLDQNDLASAKLHFSEALQREPMNANSAYYLGVISERLGDVGQAGEAYQSALKLDGSHTGALKAMARLFPNEPPIAPLNRGRRPGVQLQPRGREPVTIAELPSQISTPGPAIRGNDFYALLRRSTEPVEIEISECLDNISSTIGGRRRRRISAFAGTIFFLTALWLASFFVLSTMPGSSQAGPMIVSATIAYALILLLTIIVIKSQYIEIERDFLISKIGVLTENKDQKHLFLLSRDSVYTDRGFWNLLTRTGNLIFKKSQETDPAHDQKPFRLIGFFKKSEMNVLFDEFRRLHMLYPVSRDILAAIGYVRNIRTGEG